MLGIGMILLIYLAIILAFLNALGLQGMINSQSIASDVMQLVFGEAGAVVISFLICITCLGNINGMIFTNARVYYAMGQEHSLYAWLGHWNKQLDSPVRSLTCQAIITLVLVVVIGSNNDAFARLVVLSAPLHWFFFLLAGTTLFIFRRKQPGAENHYKVPLYPWLPIVFCLSTGFMLFASLSYAVTHLYAEVWFILAMMIFGLMASTLGHTREINSTQRRQ